MEEGEFTEVEDCPPDAGADDCTRDCTALEGTSYYLECCGGVRLGGVVLVSHDFRLLEQVADTIWVCEHKTITPWPKGIQEYKKHLRKQMADGQKKLGMGAGAGVQ